MPIGPTDIIAIVLFVVAKSTNETNEAILNSAPILVSSHS